MTDISLFSPKKLLRRVLMIWTCTERCLAMVPIIYHTFLSPAQVCTVSPSQHRKCGPANHPCLHQLQGWSGEFPNQLGEYCASMSIYSLKNLRIKENKSWKHLKYFVLFFPTELCNFAKRKWKYRFFFVDIELATNL